MHLYVLQTSKKIQGLFDSLDAALTAASLHVNLDNNRRLILLEKKQNATHDKLDKVQNSQQMTHNKLDKIQDSLKLAIQNEFVTTACFHGALLAKDVLEELKLDPSWIEPAPDAQSFHRAAFVRDLAPIH